MLLASTAPVLGPPEGAAPAKPGRTDGAAPVGTVLAGDNPEGENSLRERVRPARSPLTRRVATDAPCMLGEEQERDRRELEG